MTIRLMDGQEIEGRIKNFDRFAVIVEHNGVDQMVFKHAIATIKSPRSSGQLLLAGADRPHRGTGVTISSIPRVICFVLDSVGIGELPDAHAYGDGGCDTSAISAGRSACRCPHSRRSGSGASRRFEGFLSNT